MATLYRCDRCKDIKSTPLKVLTYPDIKSRYPAERTKHLDICDVCLSMVTNLIEDSRLVPRFTEVTE